MSGKPFFTPTPSGSTPPSFRGKTLLIPAVSIGSIPQLTVDLFLHSPSLDLKKIGRLDPTFCFPFAGPAEASAGDLSAPPSSSESTRNQISTSLEVFSSNSSHNQGHREAESGLVVIQQRSPVFKSAQKEYVEALVEWIQESQFEQVLWISSIDASARTDSELETPILHLLPASFPSSSSQTSSQSPMLQRLTEQFPRFQAKPQQSPYAVQHGKPSTNQEPTRIPHIPGALLTRQVLQHLSSSKCEIQFGAVLYFANEGDTRADAHTLAHIISTNLLNLQIEQNLKEPPSWKNLFGHPPDSSLYG